MQTVTCFHCSQLVQISPDKNLCTECGEDLQHLLAPDEVADYFYQRAQTLASSGDAVTALAEVERGLTFAGSAELHLLAAILAQQVGRFDQMRHHVAAIAVDDSLRPEAEWLLRAHQARQRALREGAQPGSSAIKPPSAPAFLDELLGRSAPVTGHTTALRLPYFLPSFSSLFTSTLTLAALAGMMMAAYLWFGRDREAVHFNVAPEAEPLPVQQQAATPVAAAEPVEEPSLLPTPTATPINRTPGNGARATGAGEKLADSNLRQVVIITTTPFDLQQVLQDEGEAELAALGVDARLQGEQLILSGVVHLDLQRRRLVEIASRAAGVAEVSAVDLMLRPLPTYTVQEGDTLWSIVYDIYGDDVARVDELFALNQDVLPSPDALRPGMELKVPPVL
jgi:nucleoid-associated protein YgaU